MAYIIPYKKYDGFRNMEIDEALLDTSIKNEYFPTLRLYGWLRPTLSLGRNQPYARINLNYCKDNNIDIVKRPTGGRAVFHHQELTYCFISPVEFLKKGNSVINSYREISEALILGFSKLGINLTFPEYKKVSVKDGYCMAVSTGSDLSYEGKKVIGSAQLRKHNYILQHGSILIDINNEILSSIFGSLNNYLNVITLKEIKTELDNINILSRAIMEGFQEKFSFDFEPFPI